MKRIVLLTTVALMIAAPITVVAQDRHRPALFGQISLNSGFHPDPHVVRVDAGGPLNAANINSRCVGMISDAPDFQLTYTAGLHSGGGSLPLLFRTRADADTTLVVNAADGRWYCDDDSGGGVNAQVHFFTPQSGVYDIWVGTYDHGDNFVQAELLITELK